jgi:hypothetical protein
MKKLDGAECPVCRGWNCSKENPHFAWILGSPQNALIAKDRENRKEVR